MTIHRPHSMAHKLLHTHTSVGSAPLSPRSQESGDNGRHVYTPGQSKGKRRYPAGIGETQALSFEIPASIRSCINKSELVST